MIFQYGKNAGRSFHMVASRPAKLQNLRACHLLLLFFSLSNHEATSLAFAALHHLEAYYIAAASFRYNHLLFIECLNPLISRMDMCRLSERLELPNWYA
jgi:hypothetical protein